MHPTNNNVDLVNRLEIATVFRNLIPPGESLLVHSSLKAIGYVQDGPQAIIDELVNVLGPSGNLLMISSSRYFSRDGRYDMRNSEPDTGLLVDTFRRMPGVRRSPVPMTSFLALGAEAQNYTQPFQSYLDSTSPFTRLLMHDGSILLIGIDYDKCTLFHLAEERLQVDYNTYIDFKGQLIDDYGESREVHQRYFVRKDLKTKKSVNWIGQRMEREGLVDVRQLGGGLVRIFKARHFDKCCMDALQKDRSAFLVS